MGKVFSRRSKAQTQPRENLAESVNGNARLARLPFEDLIQHAEVEIMMAGYKLSHWRENRAFAPSAIDEAVQHAEWATQALRELQRRDTGVAQPGFLPWPEP